MKSDIIDNNIKSYMNQAKTDKENIKPDVTRYICRVTVGNYSYPIFSTTPEMMEVKKAKHKASHKGKVVTFSKVVDL